MQVSTELREPFSLSIIPFIILIIILIILVVIYIIIKNYKPKLKPNNLIIPNIKDRNQIKTHYLYEINELLKKAKNNQIEVRACYQTLSSLIRHFIFEMTSIKVQNYTLEEIKPLKMPVLYELVSEYYSKEFSEFSEGNMIESIEKTRKVIARWN